MALPVPNLDDRTFDQLVAEVRSLIPKNFPTWTDHNPSDPGITLLDLFAFLIEAAIYQTNRVPERSLENFAALVGITRRPEEPIETTLYRALEQLKRRDRAITAEEFITLAKQAAPDVIGRVEVLVRMEDTSNVFPNEQFVEVIIVPKWSDNPAPVPTPQLRQQVFEFLRSRRLITTRLRVLGPEYTSIQIAVTVLRSGSFATENIRNEVIRAIQRFLSPLGGGEDGNGWELGRSLFRSEVYQVIESVAGVDYVKQLLLNGDETIGEIRLSSRRSLINPSEPTVIVTTV